MKSRMIVAVLMMWAVSARADIVDSGNLVIGGTGTIQGSAFSVGGATFSVAGGSVTLGGILNAAAAGIKWADGTTSTTASPGGGGDMILAATQTVSGAKLFLSSVTAGPTVYTSTATTSASATVAAGQFVNAWMVVASTNLAAASSAWFAGLQGNKVYRLRWQLTQDTSSGSLRFKPNNDGGSTYHYVVGCRTSNNSTDDAQSDSGSFGLLEGVPTAAGGRRFGWMEFAAGPDDATKFRASSKNEFDATSGLTTTSCHGAAGVNLSASLTGLLLYPSAGTLSGYVYLEQLITSP